MGSLGGLPGQAPWAAVGGTLYHTNLPAFRSLVEWQRPQEEKERRDEKRREERKRGAEQNSTGENETEPNRLERTSTRAGIDAARQMFDAKWNL